MQLIFCHHLNIPYLASCQDVSLRATELRAHLVLPQDHCM